MLSVGIIQCSTLRRSWLLPEGSAVGAAPNQTAHLPAKAAEQIIRPKMPSCGALPLADIFNPRLESGELRAMSISCNI